MAENRLYKLYHPTARSKLMQGSVPVQGGDMPYTVQVDAQGYVHNVETLVAEKLSRCGFELLGGDVGLLAFEGAVGPYVSALDAMQRAEGVFKRALGKALDGGVAIEDLEDALRKYRGAEGVNLRALAGMGAPAGPAPAPVPGAAKAAPEPKPPVPVVPPLAPAPESADVVDGVEALIVSLHWKAAVALARDLGASLISDNDTEGAKGFLRGQSVDAIKAAVDARRKAR